MATFNINVVELRKAIVTNNETNVTKECKIEPYHRNGKQMAYVVMNDELEAPIKRYNLSTFNGPIKLTNVNLSSRSRSSFDWNE